MGSRRSPLAALLLALVCAPARAGTMEVEVRGASDPVGTTHSCVRAGARVARLDFGLVAPGFQPTGGCRAVAAADRAGTWLVATLEVMVEVEAGVEDRSPAPRPFVRRRAPLGVTRPLRGSLVRSAPVVPRLLPAPPVEVLLRFEGLSGGVEAWFAPGANNDWTTASPSGVLLGAADIALSTLPPRGGRVLHQIALFVPEGPPGSIAGRAVYSARAEPQHATRRYR